MKKSIFFIAAIFLTTGLCAQEIFNVPEVPVEQKHQNMVFQANSIITVSIHYAKKQGLTAAEYGTFIGEQFKYSWNKDAGFEGYVNGMLNNMSCFSADPGIEITTNTAEKVKFKTRSMGAEIKNNEPVYGVTYKEYIDCVKAATSTIGDYMGCKSELSYDEEWMYFTISKK